MFSHFRLEHEKHKFIVEHTRQRSVQHHALTEATKETLGGNLADFSDRGFPCDQDVAGQRLSASRPLPVRQGVCIN